MTDKEIYQQIEDYGEESNALYERIHEQVETSIVKHARAKKRRNKILAGALSVAVAVILVVVLSITLPFGAQPQEEIFRYADASAFRSEQLNCNLKEYGAINGLPLLYLDWYEHADELDTWRYYEEGKENDTVYLRESFTDGNSGTFYQIRVMKQNIVIDSLDEGFEEYQTTSVDGVSVIYVLNWSSVLVKFEYQGYKYYLEIDDTITLDFLVETIESMLNN